MNSLRENALVLFEEKLDAYNSKVNQMSQFSFTANETFMFIDMMIEFSKRNSIDFADWLDKLTPAQRCSVWSKNQENQGLFTMDNEQLFEKKYGVGCLGNCGMNYCDTNGCLEREKILVEEKGDK